MEEIEQLKQALAASPDNDYLRMMLIRKMQHFDQYHSELEALLQQALQKMPGNVELKQILLSVYFKQGKISACIVIAEEISDLSALSPEVRAIIAKCYLKEENLFMAKTVYEEILNDIPGFEDEELDEAFRIKELMQDLEEDLDSGLFFKPDIKFSDVGGMDEVKREIDLKIIKPLENAELFASYGKKVGGGILLYGPPGCGKTFIAKATAGEINANFINIGLDDILDMWIGNSEKNLHKYFELARSKKPSVLFFDEIDALGAKRSDLRQSAGKNVINQFLAELDGVSSDNEGVLIIGATNAPWHLDTAFRRPGRFDRIIFVPPPDEKSKESIIKLKLEGKPHENIDFKKVAKRTKHYSGADINAMIDIAVEKILEDALKTGVPKPITTKSLLEAAKIHKPSTEDWFSTAKNYALFANKSGIYDEILKYLK
ncbi:MAG: AAA family ATPase [Bacteroidetes bacterium]|nr:MAG: AAA family ATPase [Bacteroidota bacterium]